MRSPREILFRAGQEAANLWLLRSQPRWDGAVTGPLPGLPDPQAVARTLRGSAFASQLQSLAQEICQHRFRLLGLPPVDLGDTIHWRRDFVHGKETGLDYFRRIPYLDFERAGDHKVIWELNRHQHLVALAQAYLLFEQQEYLQEIEKQITSWMEDNPFQRGINWASALEVAFRALSWIWVLHFVGARLGEGFRRRWMTSLYQHGLHLEHNLSVYFSPNTHLLGEAVALHALGRLIPAMPRSARWRGVGGELVLEQMKRQVQADGSHFEQSSYYHVYALDLFLFHSLIASDLPQWYASKLVLMAEYLDATTSSGGVLPFIGDEDGGRLFHPFGERQRFAEGTLATCAARFQRSEWLRNPDSVAEQAAWWLGSPIVPAAASTPPRSRWFPDAGVAVMQSELAHIIVNAGPFAAGTAGHTHADRLSIVAFRCGSELLIDPATFTYVADTTAREQYRATEAHNTIHIVGAGQAVPQGPFRWTEPPKVELLHWKTDLGHDILDAKCSYRGFAHRRSMVFLKPGRLIVLDRITGPGGQHSLEQRWVCPANLGCFLTADPPATPEPAERSLAFGACEPATRWVARYHGPLPAILVAVIDFEGPPDPIRVGQAQDSVTIEYKGGTARFPAAGAPEAIR